MGKTGIATIYLILAAFTFGCISSGGNLQTFTADNGGRLVISPMNGEDVSGKVMLAYEMKISPPATVNFMLSGGSISPPVNMIVNANEAKVTKELDTRKYQNGIYRLGVSVANDAGETENIRNIQLYIRN
ncbi:MAG: hypothetical protein ABH863_06485 [Candidatus Micrarchaeota archaeon]